MSKSAEFHATERRNWGFWDGRSDSMHRRRPQWSPSWTVDRKHPSSPSYGQGYWAGYYGEKHPNTGLFACVCGLADSDGSGDCTRNAIAIVCN
jgi:hypothetical protein